MSWAEQKSVRYQGQPVPKVTTKVSVKCMVRSRRMDSVKYVVDEENLQNSPVQSRVQVQLVY